MKIKYRTITACMSLWDTWNCFTFDSEIFKYVSGSLSGESIFKVESERSPLPFYKHITPSFKYEQMLNLKITNR